MKQAHRSHRYVAGTQVTDAQENILGRLTAVRQEDGKTLGVVNDDYEIDLVGSVEILDLTGRARQRNPALHASYLRLSKQQSVTPLSWPLARLSESATKYGAGMGRLSQHLSANAQLLLVVHECPIDGQGYDEGGAYWGAFGGASPEGGIWRACTREGFECFVRAADLRAAIAQVRGMYPKATILDVPFDRWIEEFLIGYKEAALFISTEVDEAGEEIEVGQYALAEKTEGAMRTDCMVFARANIALLRQAYASGAYSPTQAGRDLWFTRNHHGVGYWDRTELDKPFGEKLTQAAHRAGERTLYLGDDQLVYQMESPAALAA